MDGTAGDPWGAGGLNLRGRSPAYDAAMERFDSGDFEGALELLQSVREEVDSDPLLRRMTVYGSAEAHARLGKAALSAGDTLQARFHFSSAIELNPRFPDLHYLLALSKYGDSDLSGALESVDQAIEYNPVFARARILRGAIYYRLTEYERGITELESAHRLDPGSAVVAEALAQDRAGNRRAAMASLERALQVSETEVDRLKRLGEEHLRQGRCEQAAAEFRKALELSPTYADLHNRLGAALAAAGRNTDALDSFERALQHNPSYVEALINQGTLLLEMHRTAESAAAFRRACELDPDYEMARAQLSPAEAPED